MRTHAWAASKGRPSFPLLILFATTGLLAASCQEKGPLGLSQAEFDRAIARRDPAPILAARKTDLDSTGTAGPALWYYTGRWLENVLAGEGPAISSATPGNLPADEAGGGQDQAGPAGAAKAPTAGDAGPPAELPPALSGIGKAPPQAVDTKSPKARVRDLYRLAFDRCTGYLQREAGLSLVAAIATDAREAAKSGKSEEAAALWILALETAQDFGDLLGPEASVRRTRLDALDALGRSAELVRECAQYRSLFPDKAANDDGLLYYEGSSARRIGLKAWAAPLRTLLFERPAGPWAKKAVDFLSAPVTVPAAGAKGPEAAPAPEPPADAPGFTGPEIDAAAMRAAVADRDYGRAYRLSLKAKELILAKGCGAALVADAGKAWLYSGMSSAGLEVFESAFGDFPADAATVKRTAASRAEAWTASYYRARFLRTLERQAEATRLFAALAPLAPGAEDSDAARWYAIDGEAKLAKLAIDKPVKGKAPSAATVKSRTETWRRSRLDSLVAASREWHAAETFGDLADALLRDAISARDWSLVVDLASRLGPRLTPTLDARASYIAGRAIQLGLLEKPAATGKAGPATASIQPEAAAFFLAIARRDGTPTYYRILSQRRLGLDPDLLPPAGAPSANQATAELSAEPAPKAPPLPEDAESFVRGFLDYGLGTTAWLEARARFEDLDVWALRRLSADFAAHGDWPDSMRLALSLGEKPEWVAERADFELIYPRPFLDEVRSIRPRSTVPEYVLFGLVRSESFFRPSVVSAAGAIGLAQLMPATAAELAGRLGMKSYDLTRPQDNLNLGASFFGGLLKGNGDRPLLAMFAYNAGSGRLRRWLDENEGLPDDLFLEALSIEETRQYGRNILQAAYFYGILYYGMDWKGAVDGVLGPVASR